MLAGYRWKPNRSPALPAIKGFIPPRSFNSGTFSILRSMLKDSILKFLKLDGLISSLTGYVESRVELLKYEIKQDVAKAASKIALILVLAGFVTLFVFFLSVTIALLLSEYWGMVGGFGAVTGFYLLIVLLLVIFRKDVNHKVEEEVKKILNHK